MSADAGSGADRTLHPVDPESSGDGVTRTEAMLARHPALGRAAAATGGVFARLATAPRGLRVELLRAHHRRQMAACGAGFIFDPLSSFIQFEKLQVGDRVFVGPGARIWAYTGVRLGNDVMLGPEVFLLDAYHAFDVVGEAIRDSGVGEVGPIVIEDDVWIGARATVTKGVRIGEGSVVATASLVTADVPPYTIVAGAPATVVRQRFDDDELRRHLALRGRTASEAEATVRRRSGEH